MTDTDEKQVVINGEIVADTPLREDATDFTNEDLTTIAQTKKINIEESLAEETETPAEETEATAKETQTLDTETETQTEEAFSGKSEQENVSEEVNPIGEKPVEAAEETSGYEYDFRKEYERRQSRKNLCLAVMSLIGALFCGIGVFLAVPTFIGAILASKRSRSQTTNWTLAVSAVAIVLNVLVGIIFITYFSTHYVPPVIEPDDGELGSVVKKIFGLLR